MQLHNEHVYKAYRFKAWVAEQTNRPLRQFFMATLAEKERTMQESTVSHCKKCSKQTEVHGSSWCKTCWYPGIDENWKEFQALLDEGYRYADAAVQSGWLGAEEI